MKTKTKITLYVLAAGIFTITTAFVYQQNGEWKAPSSANQLENPLKDNVSATDEGKKLYKQIDEWKAPPEADKLINPVANDVKATAKGKKIYEKMCWICHGKTGEGDGPAGVNLNPKAKNFAGKEAQLQTDGSIFWKITNGRGSMASYKKSLTIEERWQLVNYIRVLGK